jgi:hypothetical protein
MSKPIYYRQCGYEQARPPEGCGRKFNVAWLPEQLARVGQVIYLGAKRKTVAPDELYRVTWVGDNRRSAEWLTTKRNADKRQREASDV